MMEDKRFVCTGCGRTFACNELVVIDDLPYHSAECWRASDARWKPLTALVLIAISVVMLLILVLTLVFGEAAKF